MINWLHGDCGCYVYRALYCGVCGPNTQVNPLALRNHASAVGGDSIHRSKGVGVVLSSYSYFLCYVVLVHRPASVVRFYSGLSESVPMVEGSYIPTSNMAIIRGPDSVPFSDTVTPERVVQFMDNGNVINSSRSTTVW